MVTIVIEIFLFAFENIKDVSSRLCEDQLPVSLCVNVMVSIFCDNFSDAEISEKSQTTANE